MVNPAGRPVIGASVVEKGTENGGAWDAVQMGSNGRFVFAKLQFRVSKQ